MPTKKATKKTAPKKEAAAFKAVTVGSVHEFATEAERDEFIARTPGASAA